MAKRKIKHHQIFWWIMLSIVLFSMVATPVILIFTLVFGKSASI